MKSFLSIDLDYWGLKEFGYKKSIIIFLNKVISISKPIKVFSSHEEMLPFLNEFIVTHLYNVDFHSDICESNCEILDEGTWANYYKYKDNCTFEWRYPEYKTCFYELRGRCDSSQNKSLGAKWPKNEFGYKNVIRKQGINNINWKSISAIGISVSRWWYDSRIDFVFKKYDMFKEFREK